MHMSALRRDNVANRIIKNEDISRAKARQTTRDAKRARISALGALNNMD